MNTLHIETDSIRAMASQFKRLTEAIRNQMQSLNSISQSMDWIGTGRDEFVDEFTGLVRQLDNQTEAGALLARRVDAELAEWEEAAAALGPGIASGSGNTTGSGTPSLTSSRVTDPSSLLDANWYKADKFLITGILMAFFNNRMAAPNSFQNVLKFLGVENLYKPISQGLPYQSSVDDAFRGVDNSLKINGIPLGFAIASVAFGSYEDWLKQLYGNDLSKTLGVNALDSAMQFGISYAMVGSNPVGATLLVTNSVIQVAGNIGVQLQKVTSDFIAADDQTRDLLLSQAQLQSDCLEAADLGNVTKSLSETIFDTGRGLWNLAGNPSQASADFQSAGDGLVKTEKSLVNLASGLAAIALNNVTTPVTTSVAGLDKLVQVLPIPPDIKAGSTAVCHNMLGEMHNLSKSVFDFINLE